MLTKKQIEFCLETIGEMFPDAECELVHDNPFELVIAVALSAQCTDALVNKVTKTLFKKYKKPEDYLAVPLEELQQDIKSIGLYRNKAKNIQKLCKMLLEEYGGEVPKDRDELVKLPGVGRKPPMSSFPLHSVFLPLPSTPMWKGFQKGSAFADGRIR